MRQYVLQKNTITLLFSHKIWKRIKRQLDTRILSPSSSSNPLQSTRQILFLLSITGKLFCVKFSIIKKYINHNSIVLLTLIQHPMGIDEFMAHIFLIRWCSKGDIKVFEIFEVLNTSSCQCLNCTYITILLFIINQYVF